MRPDNVEASDALLVAFLSEKAQRQTLEAAAAKQAYEHALQLAQQAHAEAASKLSEVRAKYCMSEQDQINYDTGAGLYQIVRK